MVDDESIDDAGPLAPNVLLALKEFSSALRHQTEYPEGHPVLVPVARRLRRALKAPLSESKTLTITVHRDRLEVGGAATDATDHTLSGLAGRLHSHQLKSLTF